MAEQSPRTIRLPKMSRDVFLEHLKLSGLLDGKDFDTVIGGLSNAPRGRVLARELVEKGYLTRFQAELLLAGRTHGFILGQYRILEEIGRGGMGRVFKAEHQTMSRVVALKILDPKLTKTDRARLLFQREVKAAAKLNHPNIVTAFDANQIADRCYLVMEYVDGPNLSDFVKKHGPLPVTQAADFIRQAALGLQFAHDLGMVHRDIKPANLLVQKNTSKSAANSFTVKILDFGLARLSTSDDGTIDNSETILTNKQSVMGTPDYLAPEQARNIHSVDARSDLYSLGCTFYFLVTGQVPFVGGTAFEKLVRHTTEIPRTAQQVNPSVPDVISEIIERLMAKDPDDRFQSGAELAAVLSMLGQPEQGSWIDVKPLAQESEISLGSSNFLPRPTEIEIPSDIDELWASLEDDPSNASTNTLTGDQSKTTVNNTDTIRKLKHADHLNWILTGVILIVLILAVLGIRALTHQFDNG
ncbi:serine/threonine protein kinase [Telmatocola sphagniphila]|uniref:non-specific serine/threonine protein kinase n=1 Tax=Telmatocola sphagniphila TaxID=1123043 RepID=A0A8E6B5A8_9BACT|nr:serine/threonine-protein kinase [Telmatocola sphagniphila]QVL30650.1 serine/threonine protein kinase [Telmatocola sphagniphila]